MRRLWRWLRQRLCRHRWTGLYWPDHEYADALRCRRCGLERDGVPLADYLRVIEEQRR